MSEPGARQWPPRTRGTARLTARAVAGDDQMALAVELMGLVNVDRADAAALYDMGTLHYLLGQAEMGAFCRAQALTLEQVYRDHEPESGAPALRLLAFAAPGDLMANLPLQLMLEGSDIRLDLLYVLPGEDLPERVPGHDMAFTMMAATPDTVESLERLAAIAPLWPCPPVLNAPERVLRLAAEGIAALVPARPGLRPLPAAVLSAAELAHLGHGEPPPAGMAFPLAVRPLGEDGDKGPFRLDVPASVASYLAAYPVESHRLAPLIDCSGGDGLFRAYRVVLVSGTPLLLQASVSDSWVARDCDAQTEAAAFARFDEGFARRHADAFAALAQGVGLEYFAVDCAETAEGELAVFGADTAVVVHAFDQPDAPHRRDQMLRVMEAFKAMLHAAGGK